MNVYRRVKSKRDIAKKHKEIERGRVMRMTLVNELIHIECLQLFVAQ